MLIYSMSVSVDGFIADARRRIRGGRFQAEEQFRCSTSRRHARALGGYPCGRQAHETMLVWET